MKLFPKLLILVAIIGFSVFGVISKQSDNSYASNIVRNFSLSNYTVRPILFVPSDVNPDNSLIAKQISILDYLQSWFAVRLNGKTFDYQKPIIFKSKHPTSWFWECHKDSCTNQVTIYNLMADLSANGYKVGSPLVTKQNLFVFFQAEVKDGYPFLGGSLNPNDLSNVTFISTPKISVLKDIDIFSLDVTKPCPYAGGDCQKLYYIGAIAHELTHTFGLNHTKESTTGSIIGNPSFFPHVSFAQTQYSSELNFMLNSPFMNKQITSIRSPLSKLTQIRFSLKDNSETLLSLPIKPMSGTLLQDLSSIIGSNCKELHLFNDGASVPDSWTKFVCPGLLNLPEGFSGQGVRIIGNKNISLTLHGLVSDNQNINLKKGWNFVGPVRQNYSKTPSNSFADMLKKIIVIYHFTPEDKSDPWKLFDPIAPPFVSDLKLIESQKGYFINLNTDQVWGNF